MEMHQIRYFLAVCETLNFTRAAESCNVSQPSLTRAIQKLEDELGGLLFRRERTLTHLTDLGRTMQPRLERIMAEADAARIEAKGLKKLENAPLDVGVMCTIGSARVVSLLAQLQREAPGIRLSIHDATPEPLIRRLMDGGLDCALIAMPIDLPDRCDVHDLYTERYVVAFPPGHRFESFNAVRFADMDGERYLWRMNCEFTESFSETLRGQAAKVSTVYQSEREEWIQRMILAGMGCSFMPEYMVLFPTLPTRVLIEPEVTRTVKLVTVSGRRFSPARPLRAHGDALRLGPGVSSSGRRCRPGPARIETIARRCFRAPAASAMLAVRTDGRRSDPDDAFKQGSRR
jgi:LysR family hydrogen peroxide-inducible transcriptional activator